MVNENPEEERIRVIRFIFLMLASLVFVAGLIFAIKFSQGSTYNLATMIVAIASAIFGFLQLLFSTPSQSIRVPKVQRPNRQLSRSGQALELPDVQQRDRARPIFVRTTRPLPYLIISISAILLLVSLFQSLHPTRIVVVSTQTPTRNPCTNSTATDLNVAPASDGECIGISDGDTFFDTNAVDAPSSYNTLKFKVLAYLKAGEYNSALSLWQTANVTNDAEMLIYLENQRVVNSKLPYVNFVVSTMITGSYAQVGRDELQGAYVAQKEFNDYYKLPNHTQIRLLIANSGSGDGSSARALYATLVSNQIVQKIASDNIKGVMGWPFSGQTVNAIQVLGPAHIPLIASTSSSDALTGASYFWRVAPPNIEEALEAVPYALNVLHSKKVAVFLDPTDPYSGSLGDAFIKTFASKGTIPAIKELYTIGKTNDTMMRTLVQDALSKAPDLDLIYFAGYGQDASTLINALPEKDSNPQIRLMGGDALGATDTYKNGVIPPTIYGRFYYSVFAHPDEWTKQNLTNHYFFCEYTHDFSPHTQCPGPDSGVLPHYNLADADNIMAYDAVSVLLQATTIVLESGKDNFTPDDLQQAFGEINGPKAFQGVSGQISLGSDGNPINKAIVVVSLDNRGSPVLDAGSVQGCFLLNACENP